MCASVAAGPRRHGPRSPNARNAASGCASKNRKERRSESFRNNNMTFEYKKTGRKAREAPLCADRINPDLLIIRNRHRPPVDPVAYAAVLEILG
jgi:hypothetical protein